MGDLSYEDVIGLGGVKDLNRGWVNKCSQFILLSGSVTNIILNKSSLIFEILFFSKGIVKGFWLIYIINLAIVLSS